MICLLRPDSDSEQFINDLGQLVWGLDCVIGNTYNEFRNHDLTHSQGLPGGKEEKYRKELVSSEMKIANLGFAKLANTVHQSSDAEYHKVLQDTASQVWAQRGHHGLPANAASKVLASLPLYRLTRSLACQALEEVQRYAHAFNLTEGELLEYRSHVEKLAQGNDEQLVRKLVGTTLVARINTQLKRMAPISGECTESEIKNLIDKIAKSPWPKDAAQALREFEKLYLPILYRHFLVQVSVVKYLDFSH